MLGPGSTITHAAVKVLAGNNCFLAWAGQEGISHMIETFIDLRRQKKR